MTLKQYQQIRILITIILAITFSQAIIFNNYLLPIALLIASPLLLITLRSKVNEVIADERDYATGGKSALLTIQIYSWIAVAVMFILYALRDINIVYGPIALTLAYSTCLLMLLYSLIFNYYNKSGSFSKRTIYIAFILALLLGLAIASIKLLSIGSN